MLGQVGEPVRQDRRKPRCEPEPARSTFHRLARGQVARTPSRVRTTSRGTPSEPPAFPFRRKHRRCGNAGNLGTVLSDRRTSPCRKSLCVRIVDLFSRASAPACSAREPNRSRPPAEVPDPHRCPPGPVPKQSAHRGLRPAADARRVALVRKQVIVGGERRGTRAGSAASAAGVCRTADLRDRLGYERRLLQRHQKCYRADEPRGGQAGRRRHELASPGRAAGALASGASYRGLLGKACRHAIGEALRQHLRVSRSASPIRW